MTTEEEHLTPNDPNAEYEYDMFGFIKPPWWIVDWRSSRKRKRIILR